MIGHRNSCLGKKRVNLTPWITSEIGCVPRLVTPPRRPIPSRSLYSSLCSHISTTQIGPRMGQNEIKTPTRFTVSQYGKEPGMTPSFTVDGQGTPKLEKPGWIMGTLYTAKLSRCLLLLLQQQCNTCVVGRIQDTSDRSSWGTHAGRSQRLSTSRKLIHFVEQGAWGEGHY